MRKHYLFTILMLTLLSPLVPSIGPLGVQASESSSVSVASPDVVGSAASEEQNIDSFDTHPANRWSITNVDYTATVNDGLLNLSDVGDGSSDGHTIIRNLRDLDGTAEMRFKVTSNATSPSTSNNFACFLGTGNFRAFFVVFDIGNGETTDTKLQAYDVDGNLQSKSLSGSEDVVEGFWYIIRMDYNILQSSLRYRLFFDNGSKVFDHRSFDITDNRVALFAQTDTSFGITSLSFTSGLLRMDFVDYVDAPFKEREWIRQATSGDADWLESSYAVNRIQDDIPDDEEFWNLVSPYFDSVTGHMILQTNVVLNPGGAGEDIEVSFFINGVDFDDGALHPLFGVIARIRSAAGGGATGIVEIFDAVRGVRTIRDIQPAIDTVKIDVDFSISTFNDREELIWEVSAFFNGDTTDITLAGGYIPARTTFVDIRDEFVLQTDYTMDFDDDIEVVAGFTDISILERDIFSDIGGFLDDVIGFGEDVVSGGADLFGLLFRWLGALLVGALEVLGDIFTTVIGVLQSALSTALGLVEAAVGLVEDAIDALGLILDDIVTALGELAAGIIDLLVAAISDIVDALLAALELAIDALADILFALWDALSFPDVLAVVSSLLVGFTQLILGGPQLITDLGELVNNIFIISIWGGLLVFLGVPIMIAPTPGEWIEKVMSFFMFDLSFGISILGFQVRAPAGLVWIVFVIGSGVLSGSVLGGFF